MWKDPIVEEVRKNRKTIERKYKNDFSLLFANAIVQYKNRQEGIKLTSKSRQRHPVTINA